MPLFGKQKKDKDEQPTAEDADEGSSLEDDENDGINDLLGDDGEEDNSDDESTDDEDEDPAETVLGGGDDDDDEMDSDLMDIFSSEAEEVNVDLAALTKGLEPVDAASLLIQAQAVVAALRLMRPG